MTSTPVKKYLRHSALFLFLFVFVPELILVEIKYDQIRGGFQQAYQYESILDVVLYLIVSLATFALLAVAAFLLYFTLVAWLSKIRYINILHFFSIFALAYILGLFLDYQLHVYFSDFVDLAVIRNIAGGSLRTAIAYATDELIVLIVPFVVALALYMVAVKKIDRQFRRWFGAVDSDIALPGLSPARLLVLLGGVLLVWIGTLYFLIQDARLNYSLRRQVASSVAMTGFSWISDFDNDGYGIFSQPVDGAPFDPTRNPSAIDLPGNGIDENGIGGDFILGVVTDDDLAYLESRPGRIPKHLIIIVIESARADLIGKQIDGRLVAPNLTKLARTGSKIEEAYSHSGYTATSLNSLFSGSHVQEFHSRSMFRNFDSAGYHISVISGQDESWGGLDSNLGTRKVADLFYDPQVVPEQRVFPSKLPSSIKLSEKTLVQRFVQEVEEGDWSVPHLVYLNFQAAHFPYFHEQMDRAFVEEGIPRDLVIPENSAWVQATYWNAMSHADKYLGQLLESLKAADLEKDTLVVVVGDHGESLFEDSFIGHGYQIIDEQLKIPVVFSVPDISVNEPIGLADLYWIIEDLYDTSVDAISGLTKSNCVIHYVGSFRNPSLIGLTCKGGQRFIVNRKDGLFWTSEASRWVPLAEAQQSPSYSAQVRAVIYEWENILWHASQ